MLSLIERLPGFSRDELLQLSQAVKDEWKRRVKADPLVYIVRRLPTVNSYARYETLRDGVQGFVARNYEDLYLIAHTSRQWAELVVECAHKRWGGHDRFDIVTFPKAEYKTLPADRQRYVNRLSNHREQADPEVVTKINDLLIEWDDYNLQKIQYLTADPMRRVKQLLKTLEDERC
jgi:hypothetical protein